MYEGATYQELDDLLTVMLRSRVCDLPYVDREIDRLEIELAKRRNEITDADVSAILSS